MSNIHVLQSEKQTPQPSFYIEPLGSAWAVYKQDAGSPDVFPGTPRVQMDVFQKLSHARKALKKLRGFK